MDINDIKIDKYEKEIQELELKILVRPQKTQKEVSLLKCDVCQQTFTKNSELEHHLTSHPEVIPIPCELCGKVLYTKWRMEHHMKGHQVINRRKCHFFNNNKCCPFEKLGCKFAHEPSKKCKYGESCQEQMCQFQHVSQLMW